MGRSAADITEDRHEVIDLATLDDRIASILVAIEQEKTPELLLKLAADLQNELTLRRQRLHPH